jgi:hypothetical protein
VTVHDGQSRSRSFDAGRTRPTPGPAARAQGSSRGR